MIFTDSDLFDGGVTCIEVVLTEEVVEGVLGPRGKVLDLFILLCRLGDECLPPSLPPPPGASTLSR